MRLLYSMYNFMLTDLYQNYHFCLVKKPISSLKSESNFSFVLIVQDRGGVRGVVFSRTVIKRMYFPHNRFCLCSCTCVLDKDF